MTESQSEVILRLISQLQQITEGWVLKPQEMPYWLNERAYSHSELPTDLLLNLLTSLLKYSYKCSNNAKAFGYVWNQNMLLHHALKEYGVTISGSKIFEVGSGVNNPVGSSIISLGLGAKLAAAIEPGVLLPDVCDTTYLTITQLLALIPSIGTKFEQIIDINKLQENKFLESLKNNLLIFKPCSIDKFGYDIKFDIVYSNAVLEHVMDFDEQIKMLADLTERNGFHVHKIDFIDHRYYESQNITELTPFEFLLEQHDGPVGTTNRLRLSQVINIFEKNNLRLMKIYEKWHKSFPKAYISKLASQFKSLEIEDLETICATLIFRKD